MSNPASAPVKRARRRASPVEAPPFALKISVLDGSQFGTLYRRRADIGAKNLRDRLQKVATLSPLALSAARPLLGEAVMSQAQSKKKSDELPVGERLPLDADWGARATAFAKISSGLRNGERLVRAAANIRALDGTEAAYWLARISRENGVGKRSLRAFRILMEAVE